MNFEKQIFASDVSAKYGELLAQGMREIMLPATGPDKFTRAYVQDSKGILIEICNCPLEALDETAISFPN